MNLNLLDFSHILDHKKTLLKEIFNFNSVHTILDIFCSNFDCCTMYSVHTQIDVEWALILGVNIN